MRGPLLAIRSLRELAAGSQVTLGLLRPPWLLPPDRGVGAPKSGPGRPSPSLEFGLTRVQSVQPNAAGRVAPVDTSLLCPETFPHPWDRTLLRLSLSRIQTGRSRQTTPFEATCPRMGNQSTPCLATMISPNKVAPEPRREARCLTGRSPDRDGGNPHEAEGRCLGRRLHPSHRGSLP